MYQKVFDITNSNSIDLLQFKSIAPIIRGAISVVIGLLSNKRFVKKVLLIAGSIWVFVAVLLLFVPTTISSISKNQHSPKLEKIVEGEVKEFHAMPEEGHDVEHFLVNGIYFEYSGYVKGTYFSHSSCFGGPINEDGQFVRLTYITNSAGENKITKVEVKTE
jgi:hypothetical protein